MIKGNKGMREGWRSMVREERVESFYASLREAVTASSSTPLLIFPSTSDVDSLCALKTIIHVLHSDSIRHSCYPVSYFAQVEKYADLIGRSFQEPISILLINWGSQQDLRKILNLGAAARVFVVDSHRPIHLHNLSHQNRQVVVLYTLEDEQHADLQYDFDFISLANECDLNSGDDTAVNSGSEDEEESEDDEGTSMARKRRRISDALEADPSDPISFRRLKALYYKVGTFHGRPSGYLMFDLSHSLRKNTNDLLWLACVSLTDQFVHERLTNERYQDGVMELEQHINSSGNLEAATIKDGTTIRGPDSSRIAYEDEPRLMLLQEWNLFDSMLYSSYIATKLKTWSENGLKKLKLLLARMGFALQECQQKFPYMSMEVKQKMKDEFGRFLPEYGLTDFYYRSFLRHHGYSSKVSAADVVYGVTSLLESSVDDSGSNDQQFWVAYSALSLNNLDTLRKGMQRAIQVQRSILRQGSSAITKSGFIRSTRKFRWVKLEDAVNTKLLGTPQALTKFCYFLMDALREKGAKMKPLICACIAKNPNKVLIVGVCGRPKIGAIQGNSFGIAFRAASEEIGVEYFQELFESSWILLDAIAVNSFMIRITEKLYTTSTP